MSVVGVDFGNLKTVVAVARNRGVDVVRISTISVLGVTGFQNPIADFD
jgi:heat shock 70kDa protein 4